MSAPLSGGGGLGQLIAKFDLAKEPQDRRGDHIELQRTHRHAVGNCDLQ